MTHQIEFYDGNSGQLVNRMPAAQVPPAIAMVYLKGGVRTDDALTADTTIPIVRVVRTTVDAWGQPAPAETATRALVREYDADGVMHRETIALREP